MPTRYKKCPFCGALRMLYQVLDGVKTRTCFKCFKIQQQQPVKSQEAPHGTDAE